MQTYGNWDIQEIPLSSPYFHQKVERFLAANGLRLEEVDLYMTLQNADGDILAGGGLSHDIIQCIAVAPEARSEGLAAPLVSRLVAEASARGIHNLKVFTKPENVSIFESLGFRLLAQAPKAVLMENGRGLERYCEYLRGLRRPGVNGVIVMNANPFTLGHQYLIEKASEQVDTLYIIPVREDLSQFPYTERLEMIRSAPDGLEHSSAPSASVMRRPRPANPGSNIVVLEGSGYVISAATFPTYFLKDLSDAAETQMHLDLDLYGRWIAPALGASVRFVGSEPLDALTARYNTLIPNAVIIPRLEKGTEVCPVPVVSASRVRGALAEGHFREAASLCPASTHPYLLAALAERALRLELDTPLKPGLVCPRSTGSHRDMDYALMQKGISAIRPFFSRMALASSADELRQQGIDAETAMMAATGGVNTHRGAIFSLGLALNAACSLLDRGMETVHFEEDMQNRLGELAQAIFANQLKDSELHSAPLSGARKMAAEGYRMLFEDWLPFYRNLLRGKETLQRMLLRIMSTLDDTCVIHRVGFERAQEVKREAAALLEDFSEDKLAEMCTRYAAEGISPGGAADMLALTVFSDSILNK